MIIEDAIKEMKNGKNVTNRTIWQSSESDYYWMDKYDRIRFYNGKLCHETANEFKKFMSDQPKPYNPNKWEIYKS
jgi:hypothetical protein